MKRLVIILAAVVFWLPARTTSAIGTPAGTVIANRATASAVVDGTPILVTSDPAEITVDELVNVTITWQDAANVGVEPGQAGAALAFTVTNTGNGTETFSLAGANNPGGADDFSLIWQGIFFDPGGGLIAISDLTLAADSSATVFIVNDIPTTVLDQDLATSRLTATSQTGTGVGTVVPDGGAGGTDAVIGTSGGTDSAIGTYQAASASVMVAKAAEVLDCFGGTEPLTRATITYTLTVTVTGSGTARAVVITDPIPANTTYVPGSITVNGVGKTDEVDVPTPDEADYDITNPGAVTVSPGDLTAGSLEISFKVTID